MKNIHVSMENKTLVLKLWLCFYSKISATFYSSLNFYQIKLYICFSIMQKFLRVFFVFSLLLIFVSNVSGVSTCLDHAKHTKSKVIYKKGAKEEKIPTFSQDDECQCVLHMHMNNVLLPEPLEMDFAINSTNDSEMPQPKAISYRCLLDFFSSRAPPSAFFAAA